MSIPITVFATASDHTLIDFSREVHSSKKSILFKCSLINYIILFFIYLYFGYLHYFQFGQELIIFNYGNIMRSYEFGPIVLIICNFLIVLYVGIDTIMIFKPAKQILTQLLQKKQIGLWSFCSVMIIELIQMVLSFMMVSNGTSIYLLFILVGLITIIIYNIIPLLTFYQVFYFDRSKQIKLIMNSVLIFLSLFFVFSSTFNLIFIHLIDNS